MAIALVASYENVWNSGTTPKSASVTVANGDCLCILASARAASTTISTPTGGSLTYTLSAAAHTTSSCPSVYLWTTFPTSGQTYTLSISGPATTWGWIALRFTGVGSIGNIAQYQDNSLGHEFTTMTTSTTNSGICMLLNDTGSGAAATYETSPGTFTQVATVTAQGNYGGYYLNAGTAGTKTIGVTSPSGSTSTICAVELIQSNPIVPLTADIIQSTASVQNSYAY